MTEEDACQQAEALAHAMGITFYVVRNRDGDFAPVQEPANDDSEVVATVAPPASVHETPHFDRD